MIFTQKIRCLSLCLLVLTLFLGCKGQRHQIESSNSEITPDLNQPISGEMHYYLSSAPQASRAFMLGQVCFTPILSESFPSAKIFCFSNQDEARSLFGLNNLDSTATCPNYFTRASIILSEYKAASAFSETNPCLGNGTCPFPRAQLESVIIQAENPPLCSSLIESFLEPSGIAW